MCTQTTIGLKARYMLTADDSTGLHGLNAVPQHNDKVENKSSRLHSISLIILKVAVGENSSFVLVFVRKPKHAAHPALLSIIYFQSMG